MFGSKDAALNLEDLTNYPVRIFIPGDRLTLIKASDHQLFNPGHQTGTKLC